MKNCVLITAACLWIVVTAGGIEWNDEELKKFYYQMYENVYVGKVVDFEFINIDGTKLKSDEFKKYMAIRNYLLNRINSISGFTGFDEDKKLDAGIDEVVAEMDKKIVVEREKILLFYNNELKKYPYLKGTVKAEIKVINIFKGVVKKEELIKREFVLNEHSMCPPSSNQLLKLEEFIIMDKEKGNMEVLSMDHLPNIEKIKSDKSIE